MALKHQTFTAVRWTAAATVIKTGLQLLQVIVLARLLAPGDFGLMALIASAIVFVQAFTDLGISNALIHYQQVSHAERSSLYWLNVITATAVMLLLMACSPWIAQFYRAPELAGLLVATATALPLTALGTQLRIQAEKDMQFPAVARIELIATSTGCLASIAWAWVSPSAFALVAGMITSAGIMTALCWTQLACGWRPAMRMQLGEIRKFLRFGIQTMASNLVGTLNAQLDVLIGGRMLSTASLGLYSLPRDISMRFLSIVMPIATRVGLPVLAKTQHDPALLKLVYLKTIRMTASVTFPVYAAIALLAPEVVATLFGPQWQEAVLPLRVLALWGMLRSIGTPAGTLAYALGRADVSLKWNMLITLPIAAAFWLGAQYGGKGLAIMQCALSAALLVPAWWLMVKPLCGARLGEYLSQLGAPALASAIATGIAYSANLWVTGDLLRIGCALLLGSSSYLLLSWWLNREWMHEINSVLRPAPH